MYVLVMVDQVTLVIVIQTNITKHLLIEYIQVNSYSNEPKPNKSRGYTRDRPAAVNGESPIYSQNLISAGSTLIPVRYSSCRILYFRLGTRRLDGRYVLRRGTYMLTNNIPCVSLNNWVKESSKYCVVCFHLNRLKSDDQSIFHQKKDPKS